MALALVVQPFVTALLGFGLSPVVDYTGRVIHGGRPADPLDGAIAFGLGTGIAGLLVMVFGACPTLLWLLRRGPVTRRHALISGTVLGNVPSVVTVVALAGSRLSQGVTPDLNNLSAQLRSGRLSGPRQQPCSGGWLVTISTLGGN